MGSSKNARATVAMTAVQMANNICIESKKKNMTSRETEAPRGKHIACSESRVWIPLDPFDSPFSSLLSLSPEKMEGTCANENLTTQPAMTHHSI